MKKGNLSREQAIESVGASIVEKLDRQNCEPTNRVGYNGACQDDELTEWSSCVELPSRNDDMQYLTAYYYTTNEQDETMADHDGDGSAIDWVINGYEIN